MDDCDIANSYADEWLEEKLKELPPAPKEREFNEDCQYKEEDFICECGEPIGEIRVKHGYDTCIDCARWEEEHNKRTKFRGEY